MSRNPYPRISTRRAPHVRARNSEIQLDLRRLTRLSEQLVTAVTELQTRVEELEARFRFGGRLSDELLTSLGKEV
jgi:hypothetical protein